MRNQYEKQEKVLWYAYILYDQYYFISDFDHFSDTGSLLFQ